MITRRIIFLLFAVTLLSACASSTKLLEKGDYDAAIEKSIKKLMKKPGDADEAKTLIKAWNLANNEDIDKINKLKLLGRPEVWNDVYKAYVRLDERQKKVSRLPDEVLDKIGFTASDYSAQQAATMKKAVSYYYEHATVLLQSDNKQDARQAWDELMIIKEYLPDYKNVNELLEEANLKGTNYVLLQIENQSETVLPKHYEEQIRKMNIAALNQQWLQFDTYEQKDFYYDYYIDLIITEINVSADLVEKEKSEETKRVEDGWEYVLDAHGNVAKDSLGNDIKRTKYKTLRAFVTKTHLSKRAQVKGSLSYYDNATQNVIKTIPIATEFVFDSDYATYEGDKGALSKNSRELISRGAIPFPTGPEIIFDTSEELKSIALSHIKRDRDLFVN